MKIYIIILSVSIAILILLVFILLFMIKTNKKLNQVKQIQGNQVNGGINIDTDEIGMTRGLKGYGEDDSGTLVIGTNRQRNKYVVSLINTETDREFSKEIKNHLIIGRQNVYGYRRDEYFEVNDSSSISKRHAELMLSGDRVYIRDMDSKNHTYVGGEMLTDMRQVNSGESIKLGNSKYKFYIR